MQVRLPTMWFTLFYVLSAKGWLKKGTRYEWRDKCFSPPSVARIRSGSWDWATSSIHSISKCLRVGLLPRTIFLMQFEEKRVDAMNSWDQDGSPTIPIKVGLVPIGGSVVRYTTPSLLYNNEWLGELGFKIRQIFYDPSQNVRAFGFRFHYSFPARAGGMSKPNHLSLLSKDCFEKYGLTKVDSSVRVRSVTPFPVKSLRDGFTHCECEQLKVERSTYLSIRTSFPSSTTPIGIGGMLVGRTIAISSHCHPSMPWAFDRIQTRPPFLTSSSPMHPGPGVG
ncbi:hypothetical protein Acr_00g0004600 [Actinidia rufa]|uniref:Uncharacterized protein n=1 Tax=Actinidia rufa TaxID=165716 RepID=A0A7J0D7H2_9ERIC|nr:hypothetical protein Acr_00g0004600 [Actinidia rufa]